MAVIHASDRIGRTFRVNIAGDKPTPEEQARIDSFIAKKNAEFPEEPTPPEEPGMLDRAAIGARTLGLDLSSAGEQAARGLGFDPDGWSDFNKGVREGINKDSENLKGFDQLAGEGRYGEAAGSLIADNAASMAPGLAGAASGAAIGSVVPVVGTGLGALIGGFAGAFPQLAGSNIERQIQEGASPEEVNRAAAFLTAIPQAALDTVINRLLPGAGKIVEKGALTEYGRELAEKGILPEVAKKVAEGMAEEGVTEGLQQGMERAQAGLDVTSPEALKEEGLAALAGGLLGGGIGGFGAAVDQRTARSALRDENEGKQQLADDLSVEEERAARQLARQKELEAADKVLPALPAPEKPNISGLLPAPAPTQTEGANGATLVNPAVVPRQEETNDVAAARAARVAGADAPQQIVRVQPTQNGGFVPSDQTGKPVGPEFRDPAKAQVAADAIAQRILDEQHKARLEQVRIGNEQARLAAAQQRTEQIARAGRETTTTFPTITLADLDQADAGKVRMARMRRGAGDIEAPLDIKEINGTLGTERAAVYRSKMKPETAGTGSIQQPVEAPKIEAEPQRQVLEKQEPKTRSFEEPDYQRALDAARATGRINLNELHARTGIPVKTLSEVRTAMVDRGEAVERAPGDVRLSDQIGKGRRQTPSDLPMTGQKDYQVTQEAYQGGQPSGWTVVKEGNEGTRLIEPTTRAEALAAKNKLGPGHRAQAVRDAYAVTERRVAPDGNVIATAVKETFPTREAAEARARELRGEPAPAPKEREYSKGKKTGELGLSKEGAYYRRTDKIAQRVAEKLGQYGLDEHVEARLKSYIKAPVEGSVVAGVNKTERGEDGALKNVIELATDIHDTADPDEDPDKVFDRTADEEMLHASRRAGLWTPQEWKRLQEIARTRKVKGSKYTFQDWADAVYGQHGEYDADAVSEEAIAKMFVDDINDPDYGQSEPEAKGIFAKLRKFFRAIFDALKEPEDTGSDLVDAFKRGDVGRRAPAKEVSNATDRQSQRAARASDEGDRRSDNGGSSAPVRSDGRVELTHWSEQPRDTIDPDFFGRNAFVRGGERERRRDPDWVNRSYYGIAVGKPGGYTKEGMAIRGKIRHVASVDPSELYNYAEDPQGFIERARAEAPDTYISRSEKLIKEAGYKGYWKQHPELGATAAVFEKLPLEQTVNDQTGEVIDTGSPRYAMRAARAEKLDREVKGFSEVRPHLTEAEEDALFGDTVKDHVAKARAERITKVYEATPEIEEWVAAALAGKPKRGWYKGSEDAIKAVFGKDAKRFAGLLAATSPQTSVEMNTQVALTTWRNWVAAGRPQDRDAIETVLADSVPSQPLEARNTATLQKLIDRAKKELGVDLGKPRSRDGMVKALKKLTEGQQKRLSVLEAWVPNTVRALSAPEEALPSLKLSGPKVDSFMRNLTGEADEVTNDAWIANFTGLSQDEFAGDRPKSATDAVGSMGIKSPGYIAVSARTRAAASALTLNTGEKWDPREVQETVWSWAKAALEGREKMGENRDVAGLVEDRAITDEIIGDVPDFAKLFATGTYADILKEAGYEREVEALRNRDGRGVDADRRAANVPEAEEALRSSVRPALARAADRLERLAGERGTTRTSDYERRNRPAHRALAGLRRGSRIRELRSGADGGLWNVTRARGDVGPDHVASYAPAPEVASKLEAAGIAAPTMYELSQTPKSVSRFVDAITAAKKSSPNGAAVYVYPEQDYAGMRLFTNEDGTAGFALKGDDIVSVFKHADNRSQRVFHSVLRLAVEQGGRRLDCFDTLLPTLYSANGFQPVVRMKWNDEYAPEGWDKKVFADFNGGEPDVVFMAYDPRSERMYQAGDVPAYTDDYDEAVRLQENAVHDFQSRRYSMRYASRTAADVKAAPTSKRDIRRIETNVTYNNVADFVSKALGKTWLSKEAQARVLDRTEGLLVKLQDKMLPVGRMVDEIRKRGGVVTDGSDPRLREELFGSRAVAKIEDREKGIYKDLMDKAKMLSLPEAEAKKIAGLNDAARQLMGAHENASRGALETYLYAKHAPERNAEILKRGGDPAGSGMTDEQAKQIVDHIENGPYKTRFANAEKAFRTIIEDTNKTRVATGLTPDFSGDDTYRFYAPLRGHLEDDPENDPDVNRRPRSGRGYGARGKEDRSATGRQSLASNILESAILQNTEAVIRGEKNLVGQSFLDLIETNKDLTDDLAEVMEKKPRKKTLVNGTIRWITDMNYRNDPNVFIVKQGGKEVAIKIHDDRIARAMNGLHTLQQQGALVSLMAKVNRYFAMMNTSFNPEFAISNALRDLQTAMVNVGAAGMPAMRKRVLGGYSKAAKAAWNAIRNDDFSGEWGKAFKEFRDAGGMTAFRGERDLKSTIDAVRKEISEDDRGNLSKAMQKTKSIFKLIGDSNEAVENALRLSVYKAARDGGLSVDRSAQLAKNVTVDFNKGGENKVALGAWYLFYNASIQGTFAMVNAMRSPAVRKIWGGVVAAGLAQDLLMGMLSPEDDDGEKIYDKIPDYVKAKNLIILNPLSKRGYIAIPMPYGFNAAYGFGRNMGAVMRGAEEPGKAMADSALQVVDAFSPIGGTANIVNMLAPTIADPLVDLFATNRDYSGKPIVPEQSPFGLQKPASQQYYANTSPAYVKVADWLSKVSGGTDVVPGNVEISPEMLQYMVDFFGGAASTTAVRAVTNVGDVLTGNLGDRIAEGGANELTLVRKFAGSISKATDTTSYVEKRDRVLYAAKDIKAAAEKGDRAEVLRLREKWAKELKLAPAIKQLDAERNKLRTKLKEIEKNDRLAASYKEELTTRLKDQIQQIVIQANGLMNKGL